MSPCTASGRSPIPIQSIRCFQLGCSWALPVTDDMAALIRWMFFSPQIHQGGYSKSKPLIFAVLLEEQCCLPGHRREAEFVEKENCLSGLTVHKREKNMHTHTHTRFQAQTSEKIPAKPIPQARYWFLWLSNTPHTFTSRSLPLSAAKVFCAQITLPRGGCWWLISAWTEVFPHTSLCGICFMLQLGTMPPVEIQVEACSEHRICKACSLNQS